MTPFDLTSLEFFALTQFVFFLGFFLWKNKDAHHLKERDELIDSGGTVTDKARFHHQWWHNYGFAIIFLVCAVWAGSWYGITWDALLLGLSLGFLFMLMDIVLNRKMGWPTFHLGDGKFDQTFNFIVRFLGWILCCAGFIIFQLNIF